MQSSPITTVIEMKTNGCHIGVSVHFVHARTYCPIRSTVMRTFCRIRLIPPYFHFTAPSVLKQMSKDGPVSFYCIEEIYMSAPIQKCLVCAISTAM
jgi:hypothetical protein